MLDPAEVEHRVLVGVLQENLPEEGAAVAQDCFVGPGLYTIFTDKSYISKVLVIEEVDCCGKELW